MMDQIAELNRRLSEIVKTQCNAIGCDNCGLKFGGYETPECSATELDARILALEMEAIHD